MCHARNEQAARAPSIHLVIEGLGERTLADPTTPRVTCAVLRPRRAAPALEMRRAVP
jgi:hypothetical protein